MISGRIVKRLDNLVAKYAFQDWWIANRGCRRHIPYTLSPDTDEAREMHNLALKGEAISPDEEVKIKAYLMKKHLTGEMDGIFKAEAEGRKYDPSVDRK